MNLNWLYNHAGLVFFIYFVFSNVVGALPTPQATGFTSGQLYGFIFRLMHLFAGSIPRIIATAMPNSPVAKFMSGTSSTDTENTQGEKKP